MRGQGDAGWRVGLEEDDQAAVAPCEAIALAPGLLRAE